jgi:predicted ATP-grasp superfamily ATP-dependent carboligase
MYIFHAINKHIQVYNQQIALIKNKKFNLNFRIYHSISLKEILLFQDVWMQKISLNFLF